MSGLVVDSAACVGCRRCVRSCANAGIEVRERKARVLPGCISCGMCVDACPVGALSIEREETADAEALAAYHDIWVFAQVNSDGAPLAVAFELLGKARELARERGCHVVAVVGEAASADDACARALIAAGAGQVIRCADDRLATPCSEVFAAWLAKLARERKPEVILYGATNFGRELAPRVAALLQTGLTADCTVLEMDAEQGLLQQTRPAFGGNLMATIVCPAHRPQMATVRPGVFAAPASAGASEGTDTPAGKALRSRITDVYLEPEVYARTHVVRRARVERGASIADAEALVVVGRGIGSKKAVAQMRRFAELLGELLGCSCELGCTRPVVEAGWLGYEHQVGQTGVSVAPKLLVSVGCSGAIQHVAGIGGAQTVVAINEDANAPIFASAHYKVVADCHALIPELIARLEH